MMDDQTVGLGKSHVLPLNAGDLGIRENASPYQNCRTYDIFAVLRVVVIATPRGIQVPVAQVGVV